MSAYKEKDIAAHLNKTEVNNATLTSIEQYRNPAIVKTSGEKADYEKGAINITQVKDMNSRREVVFENLPVGEEPEERMDEEYFGVLMNNPFVIYMNLVSIALTFVLFIYHLYSIIRKIEEPEEIYGKELLDMVL